MPTPQTVAARLEHYLRLHALAQIRPLGRGKDGAVWETNVQTAVKIHEVEPSYTAERDAYIRLLEREVVGAGGFSIPVLVAYDDDLLAIEMSVVLPPYVLDFASAKLDDPPDLIEDEGHTLYDLMEDRFGERASDIMALYHELSSRAGVYLLDFHRHNIKFASDDI